MLLDPLKGPSNEANYFSSPNSLHPLRLSKPTQLLTLTQS